MKTAIVLVAFVAQAFGAGLVSDIVHKTKEAGHEIGHGIHDGIQTITGRSSAANLLHHVNQGLHNAEGAKESVKDIVGLGGSRTGLINEALHHVKQGAHEFGTGIHDAASKVTGSRLDWLRKESSVERLDRPKSSSSESMERWMPWDSKMRFSHYLSREDKRDGRQYYGGDWIPNYEDFRMDRPKSSSSESMERWMPWDSKTRSGKSSSESLEGRFHSLEWPLRRSDPDSQRMESAEGRLDACSLCTLQQVGNKVTGAFGAIKDTIVPSSAAVKARSWYNLGGLFGGESSSLEAEHGSKVTKKVESKVVAPARGLMDILGGSSSSNEHKVVKEVHNIATDLKGNKLAEQSQKLTLQKQRLFGIGSSSEEETKKVVKDTKQVLDAYGRPIAVTDKLIEHNKGRLFGIGSSSSEEGHKVVKDTKQVLDAQGRPIAASNKLVEHKGRLFGLFESSSQEEPKKVVKEVQQVLNAQGLPISTTSKLVQHKGRIFPFDGHLDRLESSEEGRWFDDVKRMSFNSGVSESSEEGRIFPFDNFRIFPYDFIRGDILYSAEEGQDAVLRKLDPQFVHPGRFRDRSIEFDDRILGFGGEKEPDQEIVKKTQQLVNNYGQKVGEYVKYHETINNDQ